MSILWFVVGFIVCLFVPAVVCDAIKRYVSNVYKFIVSKLYSEDD